MAKVTLDHVSKIYPGPKGKGKDVTAVEDFSLQVGDQEFVVLVGPSGCGKSTTLRMIAGLEEVSRGDITIAGKRVNDVPPKDRDIAMVFQNYALYPHMSVFDNLAFALKLRNFPKAEIKKRVNEAAAMLGIESLLDRKPKALSGGQRQRVAVGRAIVRQPKVFLFDEPLSNLDAKMRVQMRAEIVKLHQRLRATMIYVTHDQVEAMTMGDRIVVMKDGVIQQVDTPLALYHHPRNLFVAGFLGMPPMNFIHGKLKEGADGLLFQETRGGTIQCKLANAASVMGLGGRDVILGIRPEDVSLATDGRGAGTPFKAIIDIVEPTGSETNLYAQTGAHAIICRTQTEVPHGEAGHRMAFEINTAKAHLFDPAAGERIA